MALFDFRFQVKYYSFYDSVSYELKNAKKSQFGAGGNELKVNYNKEIRRKKTVLARKKQSQFKANFAGANDGFVIPVKTGIQIC